MAKVFMNVEYTIEGQVIAPVEVGVNEKIKVMKFFGTCMTNWQLMPTISGQTYVPDVDWNNEEVGIDFLVYHTGMSAWHNKRWIYNTLNRAEYCPEAVEDFFDCHEEDLRIIFGDDFEETKKTIAFMMA